MTNTEILTKAIEKATSNGWEVGRQIRYTTDMGWVQESDVAIDEVQSRVVGQMRQILGETDIIFDHGFAKALWGEKTRVYPGSGDTADDIDLDDINETMYTDLAWQTRIQQMVIAPDPIKYLGEHLDG